MTTTPAKDLLTKTIRSKKRTKKRFDEKLLKLREQLWPDLEESTLWSRERRKTVGFITIPRPMPLFMRIMDDLSNQKPLSTTYLTLWCRNTDANIVVINNPQSLAFESGFSGQRATSTWSARMKLLVEHDFIKAEKGPTGAYNYVLINNPYKVIKALYVAKKISKEKFTTLFVRAQDIGADDLET